MPKMVQDLKLKMVQKNKMSRKIWHESCYNTKLHKTLDLMNLQNLGDLNNRR